MKSPLHSTAGRLAAVGALALLGAAPAAAQTIDGLRDATYPAALAVQTIDTQFGDNNQGSAYAANGSELDNIHAYISGTDLVVFIGGNLQSNFNKLDLFFDTKSGGQNVLTNNPNYVGAMNGLQFDAGFAADYALEVTCGNPSAMSLEIYANYANLPTGGGGTSTDYINTGMSAAGPVQPLDFSVAVAGAGTGEVSINNSNTAGVAGGTGATAGNPGAVATGIEYRIPLTALGTTANGGDIKITAFVNGDARNFLSNQVLGGLPAGFGNLGGPSGVNFASYGGAQFVTVANGAVATPADISVAPTALNFFNVATTGGSATRQLTITNNGGSPLDVTDIVSSNADFTVSATAATVAPAGSTTITVTFDPSVDGARSGTLTISSNDPSSPSTVVNVSGTGIANGQVVLDGTVDAGLYGAAKVLQTNPTGFGDNQSELNGGYARVTATDLYLTLTGNLEAGGNKLVIFFDANPDAGQSTFAASNPATDASGNLAGLQFDRGFRPESFLALNHSNGSLFASYVPMNGAGGFGTYLSGASQAFTQPLDFGGGMMGELAFNNANTAGVSDVAVGNPGAVQTGVEIRIPLSALGAGISGTTPLHVMALVTSGDYTFLSNQTLGGLPVGTGNLAGAGTVDLLSFAGNQFFTAQRGNVTIADARAIAGDYNDILITDTGLASVFSPLDVAGTLQVDGRLDFQAPADSYVTGSGSTVIAGATALTSPAGISASGSSGNVRTATRSFSDGAIYGYNGGAAQLTGSGLPAMVRELIVANGAGVSLSQDVAVQEVLRLNTGNLNPAGSMVTLLSTLDGTALVVNAGGVVNGPATVQRAITGGVTGPGYRHLSSPVQNATFNDLTVTGEFTPDVTGGSAYNAAAAPNLVTPFPTVFGYDETRLATSPATTFTNSFDKGWVAPVTLGAQMAVTRGYTVNAPRTVAPMDFVGTLNNGAQPSGTLSRGTDPNAGWHLLGNPYPAPLDWSTVAPGQRPGMDAAMYVFQSTSQYGGVYRSYANGVGDSPLIGAGSGYFVRVSTPGSSGSVNLSNANRVTEFGLQPAFGRGTADTRPLVQLSLRGAGLRDDAHVYFQSGATATADAGYDAVKLPNPSGLNLASLAGTETLAINGLPLLTAATAVPLHVAVPAAGTYTLSAATLRNLPGPVFLLDAATGQRTNLSQQAAYTFTAPAAALNGRFSLLFGPAAAPLAANAALTAAQVSVFPNPAQQRFTVLVPTGAKPAPVTVALYNSLGQLVRRTAQAASSEATAVAVDATGLAAGVYTLRVQAGASAPVTKRVVLE